MTDIKSMNLEELKELMAKIGEKPFRAKQIYSWLHEHLVTSYDEMNNLPKGLRQKLEEYPITVLETLDVQISKIDGTRKYLFRLSDGNMIESVLMKYKHGNSVCISSQAGCRMGCRFCASTIGGLTRNLLPSEMLDQIYRIQESTGERVSNVVVMGTGEPLDNYDNLLRFIHILTEDGGIHISQRNLTVSTCGLVPKIYEPLTVFNGEHTMLPLMLSMYEISSAEDAENYVLLLEDTPRYVGQIEQFEREKAAKGLFMTENALNKVLESCIKFAETGNNCFLIGFFEDEMASAEFEISEQQKTALLERSRNSIINELLPAYRSLANTLEQLRPQCGSFAGACMRGVDAKDYYAAAIKSNAACNAEYSAMADELSESISSVYAKLVKIILTDSNAMKDYEKNMTSGNVEKDVEYLKELIDGIYPQIPEQSIQYVTIPDAVAEDFSPAAYMISAFDDPTRNVVLLNPTAEDDTMLFTLAHECFPGHLYQTQYFRSLDGLPLSQQLCAPTGYSEGWAVFSELFISGISEKYGVGGCTLREYESVLANILIPAYVSIKVNCEGWTTEDIGDYLKSFGLDQQEYIDVIYEYSIDMPLYFFNYAMGYVYTNKIYESVNHRSDGDKTAFFKRYLNMGPCMFDILFEEFGTEE